jgi:putative SOS response-associated peptidase YedK
VRSFAVITTQQNELCAALHNRMPVVLKPEVWPAWLGEQPTAVDDLRAILGPYPADEMICWPVSPRVGNVKNNDPSLIEPIAA